MYQTLFHIPLALFQWPWLLILILPLIAIAAWELRRNSLSEVLFTWGIPVVGLILFSLFILPQVTDYDLDPRNPGQLMPVGLPIRGYGLMMLLGIVAGAGLAIYRGKDEGLAMEDVLSLAMTLILSGIVGARLFFVIQYWDHFADLPLQQRLVEAVNMTKGGLVVYGSFIGASLALVVWCQLKKYRLGKVADLIAPSFLVGLALGRIGCFMNGCCFGGVCEIPEIAVQFPAGSPPYERQIEQGTVLGMETVQASPADQLQQNQHIFADRPAPPDFAPWRKVQQVNPGSPAAVLGIQPGDLVYLRKRNVSGAGFDKTLRYGIQHPDDLPPILLLYRNQSPPVQVPWSLLPKGSNPIHPTQLYSSITAILLAIVVAVSYRFRRFDGQSFLLMTILYSVARYSLELIRVDEGGQFGTNTTISQWVAIMAFVPAVVLMAYGWWAAKPKLPPGQIGTGGGPTTPTAAGNGHADQ